ncbi:MAG TPA: hypothetical protein VII38_08650 [Polyangia bacterium]
MKLLRSLAIALAAAALFALAWTFARRLAWPFDLEWMEGGMLCHALRLLHHQPIYAAPSVDFVPYLYTPLYPALLAALAHLVPLGYLLGRAVSVLAFAAALVLGYVFARREGGSRATAWCAMALPAAAYVPTGAWYDLARPDSLFLGLTTFALFIGWWKRRSFPSVILAAALLVAAFLTKQTAAPFMIALGLALLISAPRSAIVYGLSLAALGLPSLWWLNHSTGGWFWTYVFKLHQHHDFYAGRAFLGSPVRLALLLGPSLLLVPWALARRRSPGLIYASFIGATGMLVACVGFGTQWAFTNAFIPGVFFAAIAIGTAAGRLVTSDPPSRLAARTEVTPPKRPPVVFVLLAISIALAPGGLLHAASHVTPRAWAIDADAPTGYDLRPYLPDRADREKGEALIARVRATPGEVLIPFHPFYGYLAGKRIFLHRMGVLDVERAGLGAPLGLAQALAHHEFALVVMDNKIDGNYYMWPGLLDHYHVTERIDGPRVFSGAQTYPRDLLTPTGEP